MLLSIGLDDPVSSLGRRPWSTESDFPKKKPVRPIWLVLPALVLQLTWSVNSDQ